MINILVRLHENIDKFDKTINSIFNQTYQHYKIIVSVDNLELFLSIRSKYPRCKFIYIDSSGLDPGNKTQEIDSNCTNSNKNIYGKLFIPNIYFNILHYYSQDGYILYLDNGDVLTSSSMFEECSVFFANKENIIWQIITKNYEINPSNWRGFPILSNIDTTNVMFHKDYIENWSGYRCGDFRVYKEICKKNTNIFIPKVFVEKDHDDIL